MDTVWTARMDARIYLAHTLLTRTQHTHTLTHSRTAVRSSHSLTHPTGLRSSYDASPSPLHHHHEFLPASRSPSHVPHGAMFPPCSHVPVPRPLYRPSVPLPLRASRRQPLPRSVTLTANASSPSLIRIICPGFSSYTPPAPSCVSWLLCLFVLLPCPWPFPSIDSPKCRVLPCPVC